MSFDILIVDDESDSKNISDILLKNKYKPHSANNIDDVNKALKKFTPNAFILNIWLKDNHLDGLAILDIISKRYTNIPIIVVTTDKNINVAIKTLKLKAYDFIEKPFKEERLLHTLKRSIEKFKLKKENEELNNLKKAETQVVGKSSSFNSAISIASKVATTESRVLISGPIASGKEVIARFIHQKSNYSNGNFINFKASCIKKEDIEKELFGKEINISDKNSTNETGALEKAAEGTIFFNEIADLPMSAQSKLLSFLTEKSFFRIGGTTKIKLNARVISSTKYNLKELIDTNEFNKDLFHRINVIPINLLPLSGRKEDIEILSEYFIKVFSELLGIEGVEISESAIAAMQLYDWPGNIRQLKNTIEQILIMNYQKKNKFITTDDLPLEILSYKNTLSEFDNIDLLSLPIKEARDIFEKKYLVAQLKRFEGNMSKTASFIKMDRTAFYRKLKLLDINKETVID